MHRPLDVAQWMYDELELKKEIYQEDTVWEIRHKFGKEFTYTNSEGGDSIAKSVLRAFRSLTGDDVVWERGAKLWRRRHPSDNSGRQQD